MSDKTKLQRLVERIHNVTPIVWVIAVALAIIFVNQVTQAAVALWGLLSTPQPPVAMRPNVRSQLDEGNGGLDLTGACRYVFIGTLPHNDQAFPDPESNYASFAFGDFARQTDPNARITTMIVKDYLSPGVLRFSVYARIADDVAESVGYKSFFSLTGSRRFYHIEVPKAEWVNDQDRDKEDAEIPAVELRDNEALALVNQFHLRLPNCYRLNSGVQFSTLRDTTTD